MGSLIRVGFWDLNLSRKSVIIEFNEMTILSGKTLPKGLSITFRRRARPTDYERALSRVHEWGDRIPVGVIYKTTRPTLEDQLVGLRRGPLAVRDISSIDISSALKEFE